jgi:hypothetical protein
MGAFRGHRHACETSLVQNAFTAQSRKVYLSRHVSRNEITSMGIVPTFKGGRS